MPATELEAAPGRGGGGGRWLPPPAFLARARPFLCNLERPAELGLGRLFYLESERRNRGRPVADTGLLRREQFDVILCDMMMPGLSGAQLYEQLDPALRSRMVFMTGGSASSETQAFLDRHAPKVVDKPFDAGDLERAVSGFTR